MKHVLCSNGSWIDGIVQSLNRSWTYDSSAYIDLFIRGKSWRGMSGVEMYGYLLREKSAGRGPERMVPREEESNNYTFQRINKAQCETKSTIPYSFRHPRFKFLFLQCLQSAHLFLTRPIICGLFGVAYIRDPALV